MLFALLPSFPSFVDSEPWPTLSSMVGCDVPDSASMPCWKVPEASSGSCQICDPLYCPSWASKWPAKTNQMQFSVKMEVGSTNQKSNQKSEVQAILMPMEANRVGHCPGGTQEKPLNKALWLPETSCMVQCTRACNPLFVGSRSTDRVQLLSLGNVALGY